MSVTNRTLDVASPVLGQAKPSISLRWVDFFTFHAVRLLHVPKGLQAGVGVILQDGDDEDLSGMAVAKPNSPFTSRYCTPVRESH